MSTHKTCPICGRLFLRLRRDKRTCSTACKKAAQRGGWREKKTLSGWSRGRQRKAGDAGIGLVSAEPGHLQEKGTNPKPGVIERRFPQGTEVRFSEGGRIEPGRVDWNTPEGAQCREWAKHLVRDSDLNNTYQIPVVTLKKVLFVWLWDLIPDPFKKG